MTTKLPRVSWIGGDLATQNLADLWRAATFEYHRGRKGWRDMAKQAEDPGRLQKAIDALDNACMASTEFLVGVQSHKCVVH